MKRLITLKSVFSMFLVIVATGCTPYIYGVPQPQWEKMSEGQRDAAIQGYNEREKIREQARMVAAARRAQEAEAKAAEARRQEELMRQRVEGIYGGTAGQMGDMIRVSIAGGQMHVSGRLQNFQPIAFKIANGETRKIEVVAVSSFHVAPDHDALYVRYLDGMLMIDGRESSWDRATRLVYDASWKHGSSHVISSQGVLQLHNVRVAVEVIPHLWQKTVR